MKVTLMCFESIYTKIISNIQNFLGKVSDWITNSVNAHKVIISKYILLARSNYITLPKELDHPRTGLINVQNIDNNECFKWNIARYLNPENHRPARITKAKKDCNGLEPTTT